MSTLDDYIAALDPAQQEISVALRSLLDSALPEAAGQLWHAHPVWLLARAPVAGFKAYPRYVTFMIWNASPIVDTSGTLVPGPRMATARFTSISDIDEKSIRNWLAQSAA
ncbi:hypothetical protein GCM10022198_13910 [Klugiella xanthotipulae]|uniref:Uncharacterized protein DUF1801 n=1 Tax=Klugiella xanthotipulae TaxID=244735 RepID=A0A543I4F1_9MICO|nr:DUF1801 domain-containing protein [Klugiella xanthotipulae]TQM65478.1 uncharacterized protein DUF1801 [Klugiella xanthotipulae]